MKVTLIHPCPTCQGRTLSIEVEITDKAALKELETHQNELEQRTGSPIFLRGGLIQCEVCVIQQKILGLSEFLDEHLVNPALTAEARAVVLTAYAKQIGMAVPKPKAAPKSEEPKAQEERAHGK